MRIALSIEHPAWAYQFKNIIEKNNHDGGESLVLAVDKDGSLQLLKSFGIKYVLRADSTGKNIFDKTALFTKLCIMYTKDIIKFKPDILIGRASPMMAIAAFLTHRPHVIFEDTEVSKFSLWICKIFSTYIITPSPFLTDLGKKQIRMPIYKELFYLHRREFTPDTSILELYGIERSKPYVIVRFVSWNASHDVGMHGLSDGEKVEFVRKLSSIVKVYISSESDLPKALMGYRLNAAYEVIHHILYYATIVISEGASMASEAAVLGTHSFYLNEIESGTTKEQEEKYQLLTVSHNVKTRYEEALHKVQKMLQDPELWKKGKEKREQMLAEMPDPNDLFWDTMMEGLKKNGVER